MKSIQNVFLNADENRLRTGWRLLIQLVLFLIITIARDYFAGIFRYQPFPLALTYFGYLAGGILLAYYMARFLDHRSLKDYGFHFDRKWWMDLGFGTALGALLMTGIFFSMKAAGWVVITGTFITNTGLSFLLAFLLKVVLFFGVAVNEELTFRSYQFKNLSEGFKGRRTTSRRAIILAFIFSSSFFGLAHGANLHATAFSTFTIVLAGLLLCLPFLLTGQIAISIGLHFTWDLFEGNVYGFADSGSVPATRIFSIQQGGPEFWTGGLFGPEVGLLGLLAVLIGCGLIVLWIKMLRGKVGLFKPLSEYSALHAAKDSSETKYVYED